MSKKRLSRKSNILSEFIFIKNGSSALPERDRIDAKKQPMRYAELLIYAFDILKLDYNEFERFKDRIEKQRHRNLRGMKYNKL